MFVRRRLAVPQIFTDSYTAINKFTEHTEHDEKKEQQRDIICIALRPHHV